MLYWMTRTLAKNYLFHFEKDFTTGFYDDVALSSNKMVKRIKDNSHSFNLKKQKNN